VARADLVDRLRLLGSTWAAAATARFVVAMTSSARLISPRLAGSGNGINRLAAIWRRVIQVTPS
jgi:hypothetical protein